MSTFAAIEHIQNYLRASARAQYEALPLPPFTLFLHPTDSLKYFNYAIPDRAEMGDPSVVLAEIRHACRQRGRTARFEFFEDFAPQLPALLRTHGFIEEDRQWSMVCTPQSVKPASEVPDLRIYPLETDATVQNVRDFLRTQRASFNPAEPAETSEDEVHRALADIQGARLHAFLGCVDGQPAGAASFSAPIGGVTEVTGIATLPTFRRRGIAARLTWQVVQAAFDLGVQTVCLTAADAQAGRVYERVGFLPFSTMLAYSDNSA